MVRWIPLLAILACAQVSAQSLLIEHVAGRGPDQVTVALHFSRGGGIRGVQAEIPLPPDLPQPALPAGCGNTIEVFLIGCQSHPDRVIVIALALAPLENGVLLEMSFPLATSTPPGSYPLTLTDVVLVGADSGVRVPPETLSVSPGSLTVIPQDMDFDPRLIDFVLRSGDSDQAAFQLSNTGDGALTDVQCEYVGDAAIAVASWSIGQWPVGSSTELFASCRSPAPGEYSGQYACHAAGGSTGRLDLGCIVADPVVETTPGSGSDVRIDSTRLTGQVQFAEAGGLFGYQIERCSLSNPVFDIDTTLPLTVSPGTSALLQLRAARAGIAAAWLECEINTGVVVQFRLHIAATAPTFTPPGGTDFSPFPGGRAVPVPSTDPGRLVLLVLLLALVTVPFRAKG